MSSWLDNIAAQHGEEEEDGDEVEIAPVPATPAAAAPQLVVVDPAAAPDPSPDAPESTICYDEDTKSEISMDKPHRPPFTGNPSGTMRNFAKGVDVAVKCEESAYVQSLLKVRRALGLVLTGTAKQMQAVGDSVKQANDAKAKYSRLKTVIMGMNAPCGLVEAPDTQEVIYYDS